MKNLFVVVFAILLISCGGQPANTPSVPPLNLTGSLWELTVPGEAGWKTESSDDKSFKLTQHGTKVQALFDSLEEPDLTLDQASQLMILQLMLQGAEEVKFANVKAAGMQASELIATRNKSVIWTWVWVNGKLVHVLMCGDENATKATENLCRGLVAGLKLRASL